MKIFWHFSLLSLRGFCNTLYHIVYIDPTLSSRGTLLRGGGYLAGPRLPLPQRPLQPSAPAGQCQVHGHGYVIKPKSSAWKLSEIKIKNGFGNSYIFFVLLFGIVAFLNCQFYLYSSYAFQYVYLFARCLQ